MCASPLTVASAVVMIRLALAAAAAIIASPALADPCEAPVSGYKPGATIAGTIRYVGDGDGLWTEIRLADFFAPELNEPGGRQAKAALDQFVGRRAVCTAERGKNGSTRSYDRLIASCSIDGRSLADRLRQTGVAEGGRGR
jgi:micrococcal nuclease